MRHEILVGLHVSDSATYAKYRAAMTPMLEAVGGYFRYDFTIAEVLKGEDEQPINRLFIISFPDVATKEAFFQDPAYGAAKTRFFTKSVAMVNQIATLAPL